MLQGGKQMHDNMISHDQIRATTVKGTDVYNAEGEHLGHIDDIVLNKVDGKATIAIMSFGGFLGMGESYHPLPWQGLSYDPARGGYIVNVSREQLEGAPTYREGDEPDWNDPVYGDRLRGYYGYPLL
jgi:sporulation protein YlmC with PRC-barrel domain